MKKLFLIVDFQDMFVKGCVGSDLEKGIEERIISCLHEKNDIAFTLDKAGADLFGGIGKYLGEAVRVFQKHSYGSLDFGNWLLGQDYDIIELCGLITNICVLANAVIARSALPNAEIIVNKSLTACYDDELGLKNLAVMEGLKITVL
ncbi:MAG: isochorismatase family protein [Oscillospiraceae bacterium]|nr:isochorismatase family protein [Oscillospiraceae bacterium]